MKQNHIEILKPLKLDSTICQGLHYDHWSVSMLYSVEFLQFLQKLNCQKPIWNKARVSIQATGPSDESEPPVSI